MDRAVHESKYCSLLFIKRFKYLLNLFKSHYTLMNFKISYGKDPGHSKASSLIGGILCLGMSILGFYVALFSDEIDGGIPFLPSEVNTLMGRIAFGLSALFTFWLSIYAFREFARKLRDDKVSKK